MLIRLCLFKSSKGSKLACKVSGFSYQLTWPLAIELIKMEKQSEMKEYLVLLWQVLVFSSKRVNMFSRILGIIALMFSIVMNSVDSLILAAA